MFKLPVAPDSPMNRKTILLNGGADLKVFGVSITKGEKKKRKNYIAVVR